MAKAPMIPRGTALGRYLVLDQVGEGGMGVVLSAYDPDLDRKVALKLLRVGGEEGRSRLLAEAQAMARLTHANVITVHDVGALDDRVFVAMELVEGATLADWLRETHRPWRQVVERFARAGRGLAAAHAAGLIHRDFKPANVLCGADGRVLVTDFGLARAAGGPAEESGDPGDSILAGTPAYMAPEQHLRRPVDARTDQFSFCVALHEGLYGERPFAAEDTSGVSPAMAIGFEVVQGRIRPPPNGTDVPAWLRRVVSRGLAVAPDERYPSMDALLRELESGPRRARRVWGGAAALFLVAAVTGVVAFASSRAPRCAGARVRLAGVWDAPRRAALAPGVSSMIDDYTESWVAQRTAACEATQQGEQSAEVLDLRMACLDRRLGELDALVDLLVGAAAGADAQTASRAPAAVAALEPLSTCADVIALSAPLRPPRDPVVAARIIGARQLLEGAVALRGAGRYPQALALLVPAVVEAESIGFAPLVAEVLYERGNLETKSGKDLVALETFYVALRAADEGRDDLLRARVYAQLVWVVGMRLERHAEGHRYARHVEAALARVGGNEELRALLLDQEGGLFRVERRFPEALRLQEEALALQERLHGPDHLLVAETLFQSGTTLSDSGDLTGAQARFRRALVIYDQRLGHRHPVVARVLNNLGNSYELSGDHATALATYRESLEIKEALLGADHPTLAYGLLNVAAIQREQGEYLPAEAGARRALSLSAKGYGENHSLTAQARTELAQSLIALDRAAEATPLLEAALVFHEREPTTSPRVLGDTRFALGRALTDPARARQLLTAARADYERAAEPDLVAAVDAWLAKHK